MPNTRDSPETLRTRRRILLAVVLLVAVVAASTWSRSTWTARGVLDHPVIGLLEGQGWEVVHDRRYRAGFIERTLMGGMIQHPVQREVHFEVEEERVGVLQVELERILFGEAGLEEPMEAHGLQWTRTVGTGSATYVGTPPDPEATRLDRVRVMMGSGSVHVRTFGG